MFLSHVCTVSVIALFLHVSVELVGVWCANDLKLCMMELSCSEMCAHSRIGFEPFVGLHFFILSGSVCAKFNFDSSFGFAVEWACLAVYLVALSMVCFVVDVSGEDLGH